VFVVFVVFAAFEQKRRLNSNAKAAFLSWNRLDWRCQSSLYVYVIRRAQEATAFKDTQKTQINLIL